MKNRNNTNHNLGSTTALTHWVYTAAGIAVSRESGIDRREVGKPVESVDGPTKCPAYWVIKGWVREATEEEHIIWLTQTVQFGRRMNAVKHIVFNSGGIGSWATGMRVAAEYGSDNIIQLFTDTKKLNDLHPHRGEDEDLYRFLRESSPLIGGKLEWVSAGKDIWRSFEDNRYMGNTRIDPCSRELKREMARKWIEERFKPEEVTLYIGIDWTEAHRALKNKKFWEPYNVEFPMIDAPYMDKEQMCQWVESFGVKRPRLYDLGFAHNNCGGFCVKAGLGQFYTLLKTMPERYAYHEFKQEELFAVLGKRVPFLRQTVDGELRYLSLREYREQIEDLERRKQDVACQIDLFDLGGCGCFGDVG